MEGAIAEPLSARFEQASRFCGMCASDVAAADALTTDSISWVGCWSKILKQVGSLSKIGRPMETDVESMRASLAASCASQSLSKLKGIAAHLNVTVDVDKKERLIPLIVEKQLELRVREDDKYRTAIQDG